MRAAWTSGTYSSRLRSEHGSRTATASRTLNVLRTIAGRTGMTAVRCTMPLMNTVGMPRRSFGEPCQEELPDRARGCRDRGCLRRSARRRHCVGFDPGIPRRPVRRHRSTNRRRLSRTDPRAPEKLALGCRMPAPALRNPPSPCRAVDHPVGRNRENLARRQTLGQDLDQAVDEHGRAEVVLISAVVEEQDRWPWRTTVS